MSRTAQKQQTHQRIREAVGRGFRRAGYGGVGVDALAKEAGVTSGAFYVHFDSKSDAFRDAVREGLMALCDAISDFQREHGKGWWPAFVRFYLGDKRLCALADSCALQSLTPEVARADDASREGYREGVDRVVKTILAGPPSKGAPRDENAAWRALALLIGSVTLARAMPDETLAQSIADAAAEALLAPTKSRGA
jgi:AcrR family transcriptional regulator